MKTKPGHRKAGRFIPTAYLFAAVRPGYKQLGKVIDISAAGLLFHYAHNTKQPHLQKAERISIDIFSKKWNIFILDIPCTVIDENAMPKTSDMISSIEMRFCRLAFSTLSEGQKDNLNHLITVGTQTTVSEAVPVRTRPG